MNQSLIINIILYSTSLCIIFVQVPACSNQGVSYDYINNPYNYGTRQYDIGEKEKIHRFIISFSSQHFLYLRIWGESLEWCHSNVKKCQSKVGKNTTEGV